MTQFTLAASNPNLSHAPGHQWAHDVRNTLTTIGLHLETLERLAGPRGGKAASAALALVNRSATMCGDALTEAEAPGRANRRAFDLVKTAKDAVALLAPAAPAGFELRVDGCESCIVPGDQTQVFRIVFNLAQNALSVARGGAAISHFHVNIARKPTGITVTLSDDGPGLPKGVKARLFRMPSKEAGTGGFGIAIARELAERNGGTLSFVDGRDGATFRLELPNIAKVELAGDAATRSLGRRIAG